VWQGPYKHIWFVNWKNKQKIHKIYVCTWTCQRVRYCWFANVGVNFINIFYVRIFCTKVVLAAFSSYVLALAKNLYKKLCTKNVDEIDGRCQFYQHFTRHFFVGMCFAQLFSNYSLALWLFCWQNIGPNAARKMLMKLTIGLHASTAEKNDPTEHTLRTGPIRLGWLILEGL